jgi:peptidoglycan/xylan/chitin deacetylase (PgdA/CDA1 family)
MTRSRYAQQGSPFNPVAVAVRTFGRALSVVRGPRLSILIFHRVLPKPDPLMPGEPDAAAFEARMRWLSAGFRVMPLIEATRRLRDGSLPANAACITFDDGYADNLTVAAPILARLRISATFFIATGFLDGGRMWNDTVIESVRACPAGVMDLTAIDCGSWSFVDDASRIATIAGLLDRLKYLPQAERQAKVDAIGEAVGLPTRSDLMMTRQQVRELRRYGMSIGAHTVSHPILTTLSLAEARREIVDGRRDLEETLGERVKLFAYPNGKPVRDYDDSHVKLVRELDFDGAVSTAWGVSHRKSDRYQLPRFTPWDTEVNRFGLRLARNLMNKGKTVAELAGEAAA